MNSSSVILVFILVAATLSADSRPTAPPIRQSPTIPSKKEIAKLAEKLGAAKFAEREAATKRLAELGYYARNAVRDVLKSKDPEVRKRAERIWGTIRWAVFPGAGPDIGKFVSKLDSGSLNASDDDWRKHVTKYSVAILPLLLDMNANAKTALYARSGLTTLVATTSPAKIADAISASKQREKLERMLDDLKIKGLPSTTIENLLAVLGKLGKKFEIVDKTASLWRLGRKIPSFEATDRLLNDEKTAEAIYDKAVLAFNGAPPSLDKDWKLCFYLSEAVKRKRSKLMERFFKELDYHPTRKRLNLFIAENLLRLSLPALALEQLSGNWSSTATYLRLAAAHKMGDDDKAGKLKKLLLDEIEGDNAKTYAVANLAAKFEDPLSSKLYAKILKSPKHDIYVMNAMLRLAAAAEKSGDYAKAVSLYKKALPHAHVSGPISKLRNGTSLKGYLRERYALAKSVLRGGVANWNRGLDALRSKKYKEALKYFDAFILRNPTFALAYSNKAVALEKLGRDKEALDELDIALNVPDCKTEALQIRCIFRKARILQKTKRYDSVVELLGKYIKKHPKTSSLYSSLGFNAYFAGKYGKSAEAFKLYRQMKPNDVYAALWRFNAVKQLKLDPKPAFAKFADTLTVRSWPWPVVEFYAGKTTAAQCLAAAESVDSKRDNETKCEAYFYIAESFYLAGKHGEATEYYRKCLNCHIPDFLETKEAAVRLDQLSEDGRK
ncbi:MAG: tetratricopeptide repeat protein [Victivallales bacterium]|nr:tetratricopeptide repeat protein [Victivallales bacterium]